MQFKYMFHVLGKAHNAPFRPSGDNDVEDLELSIQPKWLGMCSVLFT